MPAAIIKSIGSVNLPNAVLPEPRIKKIRPGKPNTTNRHRASTGSANNMPLMNISKTPVRMAKTENDPLLDRSLGLKRIRIGNVITALDVGCHWVLKTRLPDSRKPAVPGFHFPAFFSVPRCRFPSFPSVLRSSIYLRALT